MCVTARGCARVVSSGWLSWFEGEGGLLLQLAVQPVQWSCFCHHVER
jgi:hypothetical protein